MGRAPPPPELGSGDLSPVTPEWGGGVRQQSPSTDAPRLAAVRAAPCPALGPSVISWGKEGSRGLRVCPEGPAARRPIDLHLVAAGSPCPLLRGQPVGATHPHTSRGLWNREQKRVHIPSGQPTASSQSDILHGTAPRPRNRTGRASQGLLKAETKPKHNLGALQDVSPGV